MNTARFQAIQQIESTQFMSGPDSMTYLLGAGNTALGGLESYYSMTSKQNPETNSTSSSSSLPNNYKNTGYKKKRRSSGMGNYYDVPSL